MRRAFMTKRTMTTMPSTKKSAWRPCVPYSPRLKRFENAQPPELGEHTDEVLKEFGFSAGEIDALRKAKAV